MCGISGAIGSKIDIEKIKMLGMLNEDRGGDAAGIYANGEIQKTLQSYYHLIQHDDFPKKAKGIALNHSRKSSSGGNNILNAQPSEIDGDIFVLNGTVKNLNTLEKLSGVRAEQLDNDTAYLFRLMRAGKTEWLKYYTGGATFVYRSGNKTTFWVGASQKKVERPLHFCYIKDTMYFSSLERDLQVIANGSEISHFVENTLITVSDEGLILDSVAIARETPHIEINNLRKRLLSCPYDEKYSTLESMNTGSKKVIFCGGAYYLNNEFFTGKAKLDKHGDLEKVAQHNIQPNYCFKNGILVNDDFFQNIQVNSVSIYDHKFDPLNDFSPKQQDVILSTAHTIGLSDVDYELVEKLVNPEMLYYSADLHCHFYMGELADGIINPLGSSTHYHFKDGKFIKMSYYSPQEFAEKVEDINNDIDNILYEFDIEDLDIEGASIYETLKQYKEYVKHSDKKWESIT